MAEILVSVICNTYNHEAYIADAIEGFIKQKTNFPFEVLIHDDASTDKTPDIIREYEIKYPEIIKPIYQTVNQYSQGNGRIHKIQIKRAEGKYIAVCEGDDYWIDPLKLQKQYDFMETNPDVSICFHASKHINANNPEIYTIYRPKALRPNSNYNIKHIIKHGGGFMATCSTFYKTEDILKRPEWTITAPVGDLPTMLYLASLGKIGYIDDVMSVYRFLTPNSWTSKLSNPKRRKEHYFEMLEMWDNFNKWSQNKYCWQVTKMNLRNKYYYNKGLLKQFLDSTLLQKNNT